MSWSLKRQLTIIIGFVIIVVVPLIFFIVKKINEIEPSCYDGIQNQDELGVDCGGECSLLCASQVKDLAVLWKQAFHVTENIYNIVVYTYNANLDAGAKNVQYAIRAIDNQGRELFVREGLIDIVPNRSIPIFISGVRLLSSDVRVEFNLLSKPRWQRQKSSDQVLQVQNIESNISYDGLYSITANIINNNPRPIYDLPVLVILYDDKNSAIHSSRTIIPVLDSYSTVPVFFTWPERLPSNPIRVEVVPIYFELAE